MTHDPEQAPTQVRQLTEAQLTRVSSYGVVHEVRVGEVVFRSGDPSYDLIVIESGAIEIFSPGVAGEPEALIASYSAGEFLGELNLLTGQAVYLTARVAREGRIYRIEPARFRRLMADDPEISDVLLRTFLYRRDALRDSPAARSIEIVGSDVSGDSLALRTYAARQRLPHVWRDIDSVAGRAVLDVESLAASDLPAVILRDRVLRRASPGVLAEALGLAYHDSHRRRTRWTCRGCVRSIGGAVHPPSRPDRGRWASRGELTN